MFMLPAANISAQPMSLASSKVNVYSWATLAILGFTSGILSMTVTTLVLKGQLLLIGGIFGAAVATYFVVQDPARFWLRGILLIIASALIYLCVFFASTFAIFLPLPVLRGSQNASELRVVLAAGVIGGFLLETVIPFLFGSSEIEPLARLRKAALGSVFSALLGLAAWILGPWVGAAMWSLLPTRALPLADSFKLYSLYPIWQTGMALFIGFTLPPDQMRSGDASAGLGQSVISLHSKPPSPSRSVIDQKKFVAILGVVLVVALARIVPIRINVAERQGAVARKIADTPSLDNLPPIQPVPIEQALILTDITGNHPMQPSSRVQMISNEKTYLSPPGYFYGVTYGPAGNPSSVVSFKSVLVTVQQYPNAEWAQYLAKYPHNIYNSFDDPKHHAIVSKFQNNVRADLLENPGPSVPVYYMWPSGNNVVTVRYEGPHDDEDILRAYLEKYPSSIE
jgi:hypothetical protein